MNATHRHLLLLLSAVGCGWGAVNALAQQLPVKAPAEDLQKEAAELMEGLPVLKEPAPTPAASPGRLLTVEQEERRLADLRRRWARWDRLQKEGILSKLEVEQCGLEVAQGVLRCANARLLRAQENLAAAQQNSAPADQPAAELEEAKAGAAAAQNGLNQTRLRMAQTSLERHRILYAEKMASKAQIERAEALVAKLQAQFAVPAAP